MGDCLSVERFLQRNDDERCLVGAFLFDEG